MSLRERFADERAVFDLHNDLLAYLSFSEDRTPFDEAPRCSVNQLRAGNVAGLCLPVFSETREGSEVKLGRQVAIYKKICQQYSNIFASSPASCGEILVLPAIENVSTFLGENEPLEDGLRRFVEVCGADIRFVYVSLTWNFENRCGGGSPSSKGLTEDGRRVIDFLGPYAAAIDLSHAGDRLCEDVLKYLDESKSPLQVIASHSNFRAVTDVPRNLPDEIADEIVRRGGVIGLACIKRFIGPTPEYLFKHIEHALSKGWEQALSIGADFFVYSPLPAEKYAAFVEEHFFEQYGDASRLRDLINDVGSRFGERIARGMANKNVRNRLLDRVLNTI